MVQPEGPKSLVVVVPSFRGDIDAWKEVSRALEDGNLLASKPKWLFLDHGLRPLSRRALADCARDLAARIQDEWLEANGYDQITLVGHSVGALLLRRAWLNAVDEKSGGSHAGLHWGTKVLRFVLFAGISRGVDTEELRLPFRLVTRVAELLPGKFSFEEAFAGSPFITNLRIDWVRYFNELKPGRPNPLTVQLLGSGDAWVSREDSIDLTSFPNSDLWEVPGATHDNPHRFAKLENPKARLRQYAKALELEHPQEPPAPAALKNVLMIVHGIRASSIDDWVAEAKRRVEQRWPDQVVVERPTYGYLSALRFALPWVRRRYARFFRDFYTETISRHKTASISVLCHSNGTYALGQCLKQFDAIRVERVALAGSVLPADYPWGHLIQNQRVKELRSDGASADWPVGILCRALRSFGMTDLGTGGFDGFREIENDVRYHPGGHGAMLAGSNLDSILSFLVEGEPPPRDGLPRSSAMARLSRAMPYLAWVLAALFAGALAWTVWLALTGSIWPLVGFVAGLILLLVILDIL